MFNESRKCPVCQSTYLNGTPHTCLVLDEEAAHHRLEKWLGEWTLVETEPTE